MCVCMIVCDFLKKDRHRKRRSFSLVSILSNNVLKFYIFILRVIFFAYSIIGVYELLALWFLYDKHI